MVSHPGHILGSLLVVVLLVWILSVVGVWDMIQIISVLLILLGAFFAIYYVKTEWDIVKRRKDKRKKAEDGERLRQGESMTLENARQKKLLKEADIALAQVKACRCDELRGLKAEQKEYLTEGWRKHILAYLEKGWTLERTVEKVCRGIPPS
jgi:type VI protein secretion system component VasK